jgi:hypothetical protein
VEGSGLALVAGGDGLALPALAGLPLVSRPDLGPRAGTLARLGAAALAAGAVVAAGAVELAYLQASAAEEKLAGASR